MNQEHYQESHKIQKKRSRKKKALLKDFELVWYIFAVFVAGPAGVVLFVLGNHINNGFLFLLGFGGILVEGVAAVIVDVAARIARMKRYLRKHARKMETPWKDG